MQFVISMRRRLSGRYTAAAAGKGDATLDIEHGPRAALGQNYAMELPDGLRAVTLSVRVAPLGDVSAALVADDTLDIDRSRNVPWLPERPAF